MFNSRSFFLSLTPLLDTLEWTLLELPESYKRLSHTATQVGSYLFIQGGHNGAEYINDIRFFNLGDYDCEFYLYLEREELIIEE